MRRNDKPAVTGSRRAAAGPSGRCGRLTMLFLSVVTAAVAAAVGVVGQPTGAAGAASPAGVSVCGTALCAGGSTWSMYGATVYNPGLVPYLSGIKDRNGTVALARQAHLNTIRVTNYLNVDGKPSTAPYSRSSWRRVDVMIAAAGVAGMHVDLGLSDYRQMLWNRCDDPYSANWSTFLSFVANRVNTVTHVAYKDDPTIAFVSLAGEPRPVGTYQYRSSTTGRLCTVTYSTAELTNFYASATAEWKSQGGSVLINTGGLSYLDFSSGIDWKTIFSLPANAFCDIKTYGGMLAWAPTATAYCQSIGKPVVVEEFGWTQGMGDAARAQSFATMYTKLRALHVAGMAFWNLGYQLAPTSYEVNPSTPDTFATVVANAP
jgi:mannan endo-1,4-beta-mannosidase